MRLINADDFENFLKALVDAGAPYEGVIDLLNEQPTAYNTNKVVVQAKKEFEKHYGNNWSEEPCLMNIIEIIKRGGRN
jgi:hypothetical protein